MTGSNWPRIPAAFFGIVLGVSGLANSWRAATLAWGLWGGVGEALTALAVAVWAVVATLYAGKWIVAREEALAEARHPVQCCFIGLAGVATMLVAIGLVPHARGIAWLAFALGALGALAFAFWRTGLLWRGERDPGATTPVLYLPTVAGGFVTAIAASALGHPDWGRLAFGAALFSWLAIESVLLHRLYTHATLPPALRPTLGIQLAPPAVATVAYLSVGGAPSDILAYALLGYALLQAALLLRILPWILEGGVSAAFWAFTFGATALSTSAIQMAAHGDAGPAAQLAPYLFVGANVVVAAVAAATLRLAVRAPWRPRAA